MAPGNDKLHGRVLPGLQLLQVPRPAWVRGCLSELRSDCCTQQGLRLCVSIHRAYAGCGLPDALPTNVYQRHHTCGDAYESRWGCANTPGAAKSALCVSGNCDRPTDVG